MMKELDPRFFHPAGWMRKQLEIQADGLSGHLDKMWQDIRDSAWIGGNCEGWERVPYWLDGFIPLAWLLDDTDKKGRAKRYVDAILQRQKPDGWICPCTDEERAGYDVWAAFLICKVLTLYHQFTADEAALKGAKRALLCLLRMMEDGEIRLRDWGKFRWFECLIPLQYLYDRQPEDWILRLAHLLREQGADYGDYTEEWKHRATGWTYQNHIVNLCMMFKADALYRHLTGEDIPDRAADFWHILEEYNGTAVGTFTGDECLAGIGADHGTELCSVVELMYTCEWMLMLTGDPVWGDRLEKAAFNAFPATVSENMWTHQYDQQVNQIACQRLGEKVVFTTNGPESHLFGLEPHYGCCTANFNQGFPKLAMHSFLRSSDGLVSAVLIPGAVKADIDGTAVTVELKTEYPFRNTLQYTVTAEQPVMFDLSVRVPGWAEGVTVDGVTTDACGFLHLRREWRGTATVTVELSATPHLQPRPNAMAVAEYGALVFSLPLTVSWNKLEYERDGVERKFPYCDYELTTDDEWRYGFADGKLTVRELPVDKSVAPFSDTQPRLVLEMALNRVAWNENPDCPTVASALPVSAEPIGEPEQKVLFPYGCAKLRMTEMPIKYK